MTPANIRAIRMRCGLSVKECAAVLGLKERQVETMERASQNNVWMEHVERLRALESAMQDLIDASVASPPPVLVSFTSTEELLHWFPNLAPLRSIQVYRMALAKAQAILAGDGKAIDIVEVRAKEFEEFRDSIGLADDAGFLQHDVLFQCAAARAKSFKIIPAGG
jgi:transcriptional regulator with XRE-family HTH domain